MMLSCDCKTHTDGCYAQALIEAYPLGGGGRNTGRIFELEWERGVIPLMDGYVMVRESRTGVAKLNANGSGAIAHLEIYFSLWRCDTEISEAPLSCVSDDHAPNTGYWYTRVYESQSCYETIAAAHDRHLFPSDDSDRITV